MESFSTLRQLKDIPEVESVDALRADDARQAVPRIRVDAQELLQRVRQAENNSYFKPLQ